VLRELLSSTRTAADCSPLFAHLGYTAEQRSLGNGWSVVARWRGFRVIAADAPDPRAAARHQAGRLAASAQPSLVVAVGGEDELVLAAPRLGQAGAGRLLVVSRHHPSAFALQQLTSLSPNGARNALAHALRVGDLMASEQVGERFFVAFRALLDRMAASLDGSVPADDRMLAALLALTRVLFLYFVQAKGWLDGRPDYLRTLLDDALAKGRHFHRSALHRLFFGTLNRPVAQRAPAALGAIPYLNGGLFEPHAVERRLGPVLFSNELWRDAFDDLFERFRFCVREADEVDAIAPDMLGRVFERVMSADQRQDSGTFYTPESVVRHIVARTIEVAIAGAPGLNRQAARRVLLGEPVGPETARAARRALARLRVLDPAVGSGAFLLGALDCLASARQALLRRPSRTSLCRLRRRILRDNLFGVDVSPVAVRLAELRLWLAIVADAPAGDPASVAPLPNLDGIVRQGDTLNDPVSAARALGVCAGVPTHGDTVRKERDTLFAVGGARKRDAARALRAAEEQLATRLVHEADTRAAAALADLDALATGRDLFGRRTGLTEPQRRLRRALAGTRRQLHSARAAIERGTVPFFAFEVHRPDVADGGGFDVVVGNPPWVRAERLDASQRDALKQRFSWWRRGPGRGFAHLPDLSVAFLQRALELTAPGGVVGFLVPSKITTAGYGAAARAGLVRETTVEYLHRVSDRDAARFGATTYPLAVVVTKRPPRGAHQVQIDFDGPANVAQRRLTAPGPWILVPDRARDALDRLLGAGMPLGAVARASLGVKTGADRLFIGTAIRDGATTSTVRFASGEVELESRMLRPVLRGRDIGRFSVTPRHVIIWAYDSAMQTLEDLPALARAYMRSVARPLRARADYRAGPLWTLFRLTGAGEPWRVLWPDIARTPRAVVLDATAASHAIPLNTCYVASTPSREAAHVVATVMNSTWARAIVRATADEARGGYRRHNAHVIARIPIPQSSRAQHRLAALGMDAHEHGDYPQDQLDHAVADALQLPPDVRAALVDLAHYPG